MRPGVIAAIAVVSALLGGTATLAIGKGTGWIDSAGETAEPVLVPAPDGGTPAAGELVDEEAARPLVGNGFDPVEIYAKRAAGVVTIYAVFAGHGQEISETASQGSGFVVSRDGYILTNSHVITTAGETERAEQSESAETVYVQYRDGERVPARIIGWDPYDDVGVVKVDPRDHPVSPVPLGDSSQVEVGEPVAAIGSPFGQESSLSAGLVAATERSIESLTSFYQLVDAIQTDAPINRGNSGGPMFNARGEVIGINSQIRSESGNAEGVGFAVPINAAKRSLAQLIETGEVRYAWLGVTTRTVTPRVAEHFDYGARRGAAVEDVVPDSPADAAGLREGGEVALFEGLEYRPGGDLVVAIDGEPVRSAADVVRAVTERLLPGQRTQLTVVRDGRPLTVAVVLGERPATPPQDDR
jgi:2-alkenal reductase